MEKNKILSKEIFARKINVESDPLSHLNISKGFQVGNFVITSGQVPLNESGLIVGKDNFSEQLVQVYKNIEIILKQVDSGLDKVVKATYYMTEIENMNNLVKLRNEFFSRPYPADTIVEVSALAHPDFLIEVEVFALINGD